MLPFNRVEINLDILRTNYVNIQRLVGSMVQVMVVVKSDAYGHGLLPASKVFHEAGARTFGVHEIGEGVALRKSGIIGNIVVLSGAVIEGLAEIIHYQLTPVAFDLTVLQELSDLAIKSGAKVGVHLKVDIGMGRLGIMPDEMISFVHAMQQMKGIYTAGFFSHFPLADTVVAHHITLQQCERFATILRQADDSMRGKQIIHIANSAALIRLPTTHFDMVRPGITLYGYYPDADDPVLHNKLQIKPAMSFKSKVIQVKNLPVGHGISYGHKFVTTRPTRVAVLPVGYNDGYSRSLTGKAMVLIKGRRAPVVGTICMNLCMADITDLPEVKVGDEVVMMGTQGDSVITADEIAGWLDTISYEVLCMFGRANRQEYHVLEDRG